MGVNAVNDPRADAVLERTHTRLQQQSAKITDDAMWRSFLANVPYHREIMAAWVTAQAQHGAAKNSCRGLAQLSHKSVPVSICV